MLVCACPNLSVLESSSPAYISSCQPHYSYLLFLVIMDTPASKRQCVENILEDEIDLSIDWKGLKITNTVSQYRIPKKICDVSFSSTSPDVLYILTTDDEIFSLNISTLTLTKMVISGLQFISHIMRLLYHNQAIYIAQYDGTISKCSIEGSCSLKVTGRCYLPSYRYHWISLAINDGSLYYVGSVGCMHVIDSDTMTLISTIPLQGDVWDVAVSKDGKLHVATIRGVGVYTTDGTYTSQSYLDELTCTSIACTTNGYSIVGMKGRVAVVSSDLTSVHYISTGRMGYDYVVCNAVDNSLVVRNCYVAADVVVVPPEVYQPPFSLFTLCVSTIILYKNELLISLLPPRLYKLILK